MLNDLYSSKVYFCHQGERILMFLKAFESKIALSFLSILLLLTVHTLALRFGTGA